MERVKIGVIGGYRGNSMINFCRISKDAELVAICDNSEEVLNKQKETHKNSKIAFYDDYDEFLKHNMDAVVLANYAHEHAPFAIKALKAGKHVFSEVLPCQNLKEAVDLIETVEATGNVYAYGENYCFMPANYEMKKLYREGIIGEFEYGEAEYIHNCEPIWPQIAYGNKTHWRNNMYSTFYCTHSLGPIIHITGLRPISVIGIEATKNERNLRTGSYGAQFGIEIVTLENGSIAKSVHGGLYTNSIWTRVYGSKGSLESSREITDNDGVGRIYCEYDKYDGDYTPIKTNYIPDSGLNNEAKNFGHGGSDFYSMHHFIKKIKGDPDADIIDVYEALDMFLPGLFAYFSILDGGKEQIIPNLRIKAERDKYRNDTRCTDPIAAGEQLLPTTKNGTPEIPEEIYDRQKKIWEEKKFKGRL